MSEFAAAKSSNFDLLTNLKRLNWLCFDKSLKIIELYSLIPLFWLSPLNPSPCERQCNKQANANIHIPGWM